MLAIGLMSGTSLDGIDAALVSIVPTARAYNVELVDFLTLPFDAPLERLMRMALPPEEPVVSQIARLDRTLGEAFADAARRVRGDRRVAFVASHGQTVYHDGREHATMQIGDPYVLRDTCDATVVYDFRRADCARGGEGAPLVPYVDALMLAHPTEDRVALNIGGIANLTVLPKDASPSDVVAFDCGPGVMLIDAFVAARTDGHMKMDVDGSYALHGTVDRVLLHRMLDDPYFAAAPPKSTGRERFGSQFLEKFSTELAQLALEDAAATLTELTAVAISDAIRAYARPGSHVLCGGGGVKNPALMKRLQHHLATCLVEHSDVVGFPADAKEAIAFAILGYETLRERAANVPRVTGATGGTVLGSIVPRRLRELIAEVEEECRFL